MAQTQMCTNDKFDDSNRTPIVNIVMRQNKLS